MKPFLFAIVLFLIVPGCSKNTDRLNDSQKPSVASVLFSPVYAGSNASVKFDVDLNIPDSNIVLRVRLFRLPSLEVWKVEKPKTGNYIMYDHVGDYPLYNAFAYYQFEFDLTDGSKILPDKFQVY